MEKPMRQKYLPVVIRGLMLPLLAAAALPALADNGVRPTYNEVRATYGRSAGGAELATAFGTIELSPHWSVGGVWAEQV